ncbi:MAG: acyl-CoA dehydrogenase family protein, partial [Afipia sp.]|nr:acyl-CoA dehydrogenase family protein [Afipia sp.]
MQFTQEHDAIRRTMQQFIKNEINPFVDEWERDEIYPAHQVFKKMGDLGLLGLCKPVEYGGAGL